MNGKLTMVSRLVRKIMPGWFLNPGDEQAISTADLQHETGLRPMDFYSGAGRGIPTGVVSRVKT